MWRLRREIAVLTGLDPSRRFLSAAGLDAVAGWGFKDTARRARRLAARQGLTYFAIEDGFLRSVLPGRAEPALSYVCDPVGIYYDASRPSRLEALARARAADPAGAAAAAGPVLDGLRTLGLSKYNAFENDPAALAVLGDDPESNVLVVDQTCGDASIAGARADAARFAAMAAAAAEENPGRRIVLRAHPDGRLRRRRGHFGPEALAALVATSPALREADRAGLLTRLEARLSPAAILARVGRVYAVSSLMGFEALVHGRPVVCFGAAFYAGWGLTDDRVPVPRRTPAPLEALAAAALIDYPVYLDPATLERTDVMTTMERLAVGRAAHAARRRR